MPTAVENLFSLLKDKKYDEMSKLVQSDDSLINAVNPDEDESLFQVLFDRKGQVVEDLMLYLLKHPKFNFDYQNTALLSNLDVLVTSSRVGVLKSVIDNPALLFNHNELTYKTAKNKLDSGKSLLDARFQKNPNDPLIKPLKSRYDQQAEITSLLREATILHAIKIDDAKIIKDLDQLGAKPTDNKNVQAWLDSKLKPVKMASNPNVFLNSNNTSSAQQIRDLEEKIETA